MPVCRPLVQLGGSWLIGEWIALLLVLIPAQLLARSTLDDRHLLARAAMQVALSGSLFLFLLPEIVFALRPGRGWQPLLSDPAWFRNLELQGIALRGGGTPIPYDPPKRLVASGLYRYIANPMQFSCALVMTAWGGVLRNPWVALAGVMSFLYGAGIANWDEGEDLKPDSESLGSTIASTCVPGVSDLRRGTIRTHRGRGYMSPRPAVRVQTCGDGLRRVRQRRITYDPMDGTEPEEGVSAMARGLEHIHLGWALAGACLRLPGISHFAQLLADASGFGEQIIARRTQSTDRVCDPKS